MKLADLVRAKTEAAEAKEREAKRAYEKEIARQIENAPSTGRHEAFMAMKHISNMIETSGECVLKEKRLSAFSWPAYPRSRFDDNAAGKAQAEATKENLLRMLAEEGLTGTVFLKTNRYGGRENGDASWSDIDLEVKVSWK